MSIIKWKAEVRTTFNEDTSKCWYYLKHGTKWKRISKAAYLDCTNSTISSSTEVETVNGNKITSTRIVHGILQDKAA